MKQAKSTEGHFLEGPEKKSEAHPNSGNFPDRVHPSSVSPAEMHPDSARPETMKAENWSHLPAAGSKPETMKAELRSH